MAFLTIGGVDVPVLEGRAVEQTERVGVSVRTVAGNLRSAYHSEHRVWQVTTGLMLSADITTIQNAGALGAHVSCTGDLLGETVTCELTFGDKVTVNVEGGDGTHAMYSMQITLRETGANDPQPVISDATAWYI